MFRCDVHGELKTEWCNECEKIFKCDCSVTTQARFKDLIFDCDMGERTTTIYITHCKNCGQIFDIH